MKKLLTAGALAGAIALTPALAAPAHAGNNDDALLGIGLALALGTAVYIASENDNNGRHYSSHNGGRAKAHVHTKHCNHGNHNNHVRTQRDDYHGNKHDRQYNRDYDRRNNHDYRRGDRNDHYRNNGHYNNDRYSRNYNRFDARDARRVAKRQYNIDVQETFRRDNKIIVKGWDRRHRWTKIAFNARTGEVVNIDKKNRRG